MSSGALALQVNGHEFSFEPSHTACPECGEEAGYDSSVDVTTDSAETDVTVTFRCAGCEATVETVSRSGSTEDAPDGDGQVVIEWIEEYAETEGRHPSKSKCIQDLPFEIFQAQKLLNELLAEDRIEEAEELRAGGKITVYRPT